MISKNCHSFFKYKHRIRICFHRLPYIITIQQTEAWIGPLGKKYHLLLQQTQIIQPEGLLLDLKSADSVKSQILTFTLWATGKVDAWRGCWFWYWCVDFILVLQGLSVYIQNKPYCVLSFHYHAWASLWTAVIYPLLPAAYSSAVFLSMLLTVLDLSFSYLCS